VKIVQILCNMYVKGKMTPVETIQKWARGVGDERE
jgi:hypothetical protein